MDDGTQQQRVWPVFVLAAGVVALGSWLAMLPPSAVTGEELPHPFLSTPERPETTDIAEPIRLARGTEPQQLRASIRQVRRDSGHEVRIAIELLLIESGAEKLGDDLSFERRYTEVDVTLEADGEALGPGVTTEVERLVETARHRVRARTTGELVSAELVSAEANQLGQLLSVIEEAVAIARPRVPRDALRQGESWSWRIQPTSPLATGNTTVTSQVIGSVPEGIVVEIRIETKTTWDLSTEAGSQHIEARGGGHGIAIWDAEHGTLVRSEVLWDADRGPAAEGASSVWVNLVSE